MKKKGMNKTELAREVARKTGISLEKARSAINAIFSTAPGEGIIASELAKGNSVIIRGFGVFVGRKRKKRQGRNPQTGESITIPATKFPAFTAGETLKERVATGGFPGPGVEERSICISRYRIYTVNSAT